jgi:hypothetical protein
MKFLTIGSDPELFLQKGEKIVSAIGKVGGTKMDPKPLGNGFYVQEDNVLVEYNTPPCGNKESFVEAIAEGQRLVTELLPVGHTLVVKTSNHMDASQVRAKKAKQFGCDPDFNAWSGELQIIDAPRTNLRTAGGHVYVGYEDSTEELNIKIAKALDIFLGLPSVALDPDADRRTLYGKAGSFRHKSFGLEYRTLSSFWIAKPELVSWVYEGVQKALKFTEEGGVDKLDYIDGLYIQSAINDSNLCIGSGNSYRS